MNIPKLFRMVILYALALGLIFAAQAAAAMHPAETKRPPVILCPYNQGVGPTIVPNDGGTRFEYRQVLFRGQSIRKPTDLPMCPSLISGLDFHTGD